MVNDALSAFITKQRPKNLDHELILALYKETATVSEKEKLLNDYDQKYDVDFDPEELLELIVDEIKSNNETDTEFLSTLDSPYLKWNQIQKEIKSHGFASYAELMTPLIVACGLDLN